MGERFRNLIDSAVVGNVGGGRLDSVGASIIAELERSGRGFRTLTRLGAWT